MNLLKPRSIEEYVVNLLQKKPLSGAELLGEIGKRREGTTKQALYAALRKMRAQEIVVMHKKRISLSSVWVIKMAEFFQLAKHYYAKEATADEGFLNLQAGEKVSYTFKNPHAADIFWGHAFDILSEIMPAGEPIYLYNPHEWFFIARYETEKALFEKARRNGKRVFLLAGGAEFLDRMVSREFDGTVTQYHPSGEPLVAKRNYYANVFGDFLIEAWLDETAAKLLDGIYRTTASWDESVRADIVRIVTAEGTTKLTISRNPRKAAKLRRLIGSHFHVKK